MRLTVRRLEMFHEKRLSFHFLRAKMQSMVLKNTYDITIRRTMGRVWHAGLQPVAMVLSSNS